MSTNGTVATPDNPTWQLSDPPAAQDASSRLGNLTLRESEQRRVHRPFHWLKRLFIFALLIGGGAYSADHYGLISLRSQMKAPVLKAHTISRSSAEVVLSLSGIILPKSTVNVTPLVPGPIVELPVQEGDLVKKGDLLAKILDTNYIADLHQAEASLALAKSQLLELENGSRVEDIDRVKAQLDAGKADLELQERNVVRLGNIQVKGVVTRSERDTADAKLKTAQAAIARLQAELKLSEQGPRVESIAAAKAEVARAQATMEKAQFFCDHASVLAPIDGKVLERKAELGELSRSDYFLTSLCVIGDLNNMEVQVDVQERQLSRIEIGQTCRVIPDAYPDAIYQGVLERIQSKVNRQRGVVRVIVSLKNPDYRLISEMNGRVEFLDPGLTEAQLDVVPIPNDAIVIGDAESLVYKWLDGRIEVAPVKTLGKSKSGDFTLVQGAVHDKDIVLLLENSKPPTVGFATQIEMANAVDVK